MSGPNRQRFILDTTPGSGSVFAPTEGYEPDAADYRDMMRARWGKHNFRQDMEILARTMLHGPHWDAIEIVGPYSAEARDILIGIREQKRGA